MVLQRILAKQNGAVSLSSRVSRSGFCTLLILAALPSLALGRAVDLSLTDDVSYRIYGARSVSFVNIELENQSDQAIEVVLRSGTELIPSDPGFQTMVVTESVVASLEPGERVVRRVPAACIAFAKALPPTSIDFQLSGNIDDEDLRALLEVQSVSQFAVWVLTDDITWPDVVQEYLGDRSRALSESALAVRQLRSAGIDVSGKRLLSEPVVYWESFGQLPGYASDPEHARATVAATNWHTSDGYLDAVASDVRLMQMTDVLSFAIQPDYLQRAAQTIPTFLANGASPGNALGVAIRGGHGSESPDLSGQPDPDREELVRILLDAGADPNSGDATHPLLAAVDICSLELVELLVDRGADIDATDPFGATAVDNAARCEDSSIAGFLIQEGADPDP